MGKLLDDTHFRGASLKRIPLVVLGFGKVGQALATLLAERDGFVEEGVRITLVAACDRSGGVMGDDLSIADVIAAKRTGSGLRSVGGSGRADLRPSEALSRYPEAILVDASPTDPSSGEPGLSAIRHALQAGHSTVLASKGPLVVAFAELRELAERNRCRIGMSAAVGTPLPVLELGHVGLRGSELHAFRGIFNTAANRILARMESGLTYEDAKKDAERAGVLESDPRLDVEGWDTAFKILILARSFWSPSIAMDSLTVQGIEGITQDTIARAQESGGRVRLVGAARREPSGELTLQVRVETLMPSDPLHALTPDEKGVELETTLMGRLFVRTGKSGPEATAAALVKDILNIAAHPAVLAV